VKHLEVSFWRIVWASICFQLSRFSASVLLFVRKESEDKSDVYNFGLVLMEVLMGKMPTMGPHGPKELVSKTKFHMHTCKLILVLILIYK
jgi:hypothetical protein